MLIVRKTVGACVEILFCRDRYEKVLAGDLVALDTGDAFSVYHGKTVEQVITANGLYNYTWTSVMAQVS